jgi:CelD/BcsL family acetyltransferase involved in cellulose biosynthesis
MNIRIIDNIDALDALAPAWNALEKKCELPMQQFIWARACASVLRHKYDLCVVAIEEDGKINALAPLAREHGNRYLEVLGVKEYGEPTDVIYADQNALHRLAAAIRGLGMPLLLKRVPSDSPFKKSMETAFHGRGLLNCARDTGSPWIALDSSWLDPETHLNSGRRSDLRRARRNAEEIGPVSCEIIVPSKENLPALLQQAFMVEAASWKGQSGTAMAMDPLRGEFYREYAISACEEGILRICFLRIGDKTAAMQIAVEYAKKFWLLKIGYDNRFARCSPGMLLLRESIRHAAAGGLNSYEFLGTVESCWKVWTPLERNYSVLRGYPFGFQGVAALVGDVVRHYYHSHPVSTGINKLKELIA